MLMKLTPDVVGKISWPENIYADVVTFQGPLELPATQQEMYQPKIKQ